MQPEGPIRHTKHIVRVFLLLVALLVALVLGRGFFVPESWGEHGWYRAEAVDEHRGHPLRHQGDAACGGCHDDVLATKQVGVHRTVDCELCHSAVADHVADGEVVAAMPIAPSLELCSRCHRQLNARPTGFPQINPRQHLEDLEVELSDNVCIECHDPHSPADL